MLKFSDISPDILIYREGKKVMSKMIKVTKEEFYKVIGPLDVIVSAYPKETLFTLRNSREVVGRTSGYKTDTDEAFYELSEKWIAKARGNKMKEKAP